MLDFRKQISNNKNKIINSLGIVQESSDVKVKKMNLTADQYSIAGP